MSRSILWQLAPLLALAALLPVRAVTVNADFSRDIVNGTNPGPNPAPSLYAGTGPAPDGGTLWNDLQIPLAATGDQGANTIVHPLQFDDLVSSDGTPTSIAIQLESGFSAAFNGTAALGGSVQSLQNDRVFPSQGNPATLKVLGLDPTKQYSLFLIGSGGFSTAFTIDSVTKIAAGSTYDGTWTEGEEHVSFTGLSPSPAGEISIGIRDGSDPIDSFGVLAGLQIAEIPVNFLYPSSASTTGGQFNASYPPSNMMNGGFSGPTGTISTVTDYLAANQNYATASGTTANFDLTFDFAAPARITAMHVWNYIFRNGGGGTTSFNNGVNSYTLTFYDGPGATGSVVGPVHAGNLARARFNALNSAQTVYFPAPYTEVRSVVMRVLSNFSVTSFTGINELAFDGTTGSSAPAIASFTASAPFVQRPATPTLNWSVTGDITSLVITPGIGDVTALTSDGGGSIPVSPLGEQTYTLTLNGSTQQSVSVVGLPPKEKLHLYLFIGQSNMQGAGAPYSASLDAPDPRVIKFGSRNGMEPVWVKGSHNLTSLGTTNNGIGMGIEFGKSILAAQSDPEIVVGIINHAIGSSAIQWWAPGVINNKQVNPVTGQNYRLYDEAVQRVADASENGVLKGVLWHQGEYNCGNNTDPASDPDGYAARLQALVTNLRASFANPSLPFVCGKFVPATWVYADGSPGAFTGLPFRATVEAALADLPNQRANTFCVDNNGLRGRSDQLIHFDSYSQRLLGQRYAAAIHDFYSDPHLLYLGGFFTPAQLALPQFTDPNGDIDGDGLPSLLEFAFGTDPSKPESGSPVVLSSIDIPGEGEFPALTFRRRIDTDAPTYLVEVSDNLTAWISNTEGEAAVTEMVGAAEVHGDGFETVTIRHVLPVGGTAKRFLRVKVTQP
jgi:hypothetical protein